MACTDADTAALALIAAAAGPQKVSGDAGSVEQYALSDRIALDRYLHAKCASTGPRRGLRFTRLIPPGTST